MKHVDPKNPDQRSGTEFGAVKSATRVLDLFESLGRWDAEKTHVEIASELGIPKSSLTQLLKTLVNRGYLAYVPASKGYELGPAIANLAKRVNESADLMAAAKSVLPWVTAETHESCALNVLKGTRSEVKACVMSSQRLVYHMELGDTAPLYATSGGKALLAFLSDEMRKEYMSQVKFERITPNTITSAKLLEKELAKVRASGYAFVMEEFTLGIAGVARPILNKLGHPVASINVAIPTVRFNDSVRELCMTTLNKAVETFRSQLRFN